MNPGLEDAPDGAHGASPEALWDAALALLDLGLDEPAADLLRAGHAAGWPGFLVGLARHAPERTSPEELLELSLDPLANHQLVLARALLRLGRPGEARAAARRALAQRGAPLDPELLDELAGLLG